MKTAQLCICDKCLNPILDPEQGFIVQGNIYGADPNQMLGIIGNNIDKDEVKKVAFCKKCFIKILDLDCTQQVAENILDKNF
jgi:hypothetical protein